MNTLKQTIVVFQLIKHDFPGTLHTSSNLSFKHDYAGKVIYCSMQRSHQHCASFAELLLKRCISKVKDRGGEQETNIFLIGQGRSYHCDRLNNQYTKMVE